MIPALLQSEIEAVLTASWGKEARILKAQPLDGGCINRVLRLTTTNGQLCLKYNTKTETHFFPTEAQGLDLLAQSGAVTVPAVIAVGETAHYHYLLLDYVEAAKDKKKEYWESLATSVAALHRIEGEYYGLDYNNYIGALPQTNTPHTNGYDFWVNCRLEPQLALAVDSGRMGRESIRYFNRLYALLPNLIPHEGPVLLHGDLWINNILFQSEPIEGVKARAILIDPAVYYGFREAEIAYTKLFGGFDAAFHQFYQTLHPLEPNFQDRVEVYNLYPLLVHVNLFGGHYPLMVFDIIRKYY